MNGARGRGQALRREIADSWKRVSMAGLTPSSDVVARPLDFDPGSRLLHASAPVMQGLEQELSGARVGALLADKAAVIVGRYFGEMEVLRGADRVGAYVGAEFTEEVSGTNAIATPHETRTPVFIRGEEHYLESMKAFRCIGVPIHHPLTNRLEGVLDLMTDAQVEESLMRFIAARVVRDIQHQLVNDMDSQTAAAIAAFHAMKSRTDDALILFGEDYMLNNRSSLELLDASDHRDLAALSAEVRAGDGALNVTLSSGRSVGVKVSSLSSDSTKLLRITPAKVVKKVVPRNRALKRSSDEVVELEITQSKTALGHVLVTGENGSGRTLVARRLAGDAAVGIVHVGRLPDTAAVLEHISGALRADPRPDFVIVEDIDLLDDRAHSELARIITSNRGKGLRFILTQTAETGEEPEGYLQSLCVSHIRLKPLRALLPEFGSIVNGLLSELSPDSDVRIGTEALDLLKAHPWRGNFNELRAVLENVLEQQPGNEIGVDHIPERYQRPHRPQKRRLSELEASEQAVIEAALARNGGNKVHAANELGISRSTLYARLKYFGIS